MGYRPERSQSRTRTCNLAINSRLLCQLSYLGMTPKSGVNSISRSISHWLLSHATMLSARGDDSTRRLDFATRFAIACFEIPRRRPSSSSDITRPVHSQKSSKSSPKISRSESMIHSASGHGSGSTGEFVSSRAADPVEISSLRRRRRTSCARGTSSCFASSVCEKTRPDEFLRSRRSRMIFRTSSSGRRTRCDTASKTNLDTQ